MSEDAVVTSVVGPILVITLDRPEVRHAINSDLSLGVLRALTQLDSDDDLRVGVITGSGVYRHGSRKPLVAAIEGVALGGGLELALVADLLVAASDATFGSPEVRFGLFPGGGALLKLPRTMPLAVVTRLALTGQPITARTALEHGLVVEVTEPGGALAAAMDLAGMIARNAPLGVQAGKRLLRESPGLTEDELWAAQLELINTVFTSEDAGEGARSFAEKRSPEWRGR
jgi:enoyl-CoA hydratase